VLERSSVRYCEGVDAARVRRWIAGFEAAAEADREALRGRGADAAWAISLALSMIDSADQAGLGRWAAESQRQADDAAVRAIWRQLRERLPR
jgi:ferric-dicitrate binding protein FerR (iron transport regulator)